MLLVSSLTFLNWFILEMDFAAIPSLCPVVNKVTLSFAHIQNITRFAGTMLKTSVQLYYACYICNSRKLHNLKLLKWHSDVMNILSHQNEYSVCSSLILLWVCIFITAKKMIPCHKISKCQCMLGCLSLLIPYDCLHVISVRKKERKKEWKKGKRERKNPYSSCEVTSVHFGATGMAQTYRHWHCYS